MWNCCSNFSLSPSSLFLFFSLSVSLKNYSIDVIATLHIHGKSFLLYTLISFQFEVWTFFSRSSPHLLFPLPLTAADVRLTWLSFKLQILFVRECERARIEIPTEQSIVQFTIDRVIGIVCPAGHRNDTITLLFNNLTLMKCGSSCRYINSSSSRCPRAQVNV